MITLATFPRVRLALAEFGHRYDLQLRRDAALPDDWYDHVERSEAELVVLSDEDIQALTESLDSGAMSDVEYAAPLTCDILESCGDGILGPSLWVQ